MLRALLGTGWIVLLIVWGIHADHLWQAFIMTVLLGLVLLLAARDRAWRSWGIPALAFVILVFAQYGPLK
jgi:hypothetical protein